MRNHFTGCFAIRALPLAVPFILVICIPCDANEPDTICIAQRSVKIPTIFPNGLLASGDFLDNQLTASLLPYLLAV